MFTQKLSKANIYHTFILLVDLKRSKRFCSINQSVYLQILLYGKKAGVCRNTIICFLGATDHSPGIIQACDDVQ